MALANTTVHSQVRRPQVHGAPGRQARQEACSRGCDCQRLHFHARRLRQQCYPYRAGVWFVDNNSINDRRFSMGISGPNGAFRELWCRSPEIAFKFGGMV